MVHIQPQLRDKNGVKNCSGRQQLCFTRRNIPFGPPSIVPHCNNHKFERRTILSQHSDCEAYSVLLQALITQLLLPHLLFSWRRRCQLQTGSTLFR
ncbi:hypothetical protein GDO81_014773 [Engystomops pustulosus]|uniref:Uncharacterized protein n=1 Tax=Engystomops pustulosus TaxID=76066 RepID=A0AAV7AEU6_ENGPU|nr:hypothetical protein GDO81_014773 [Engystomops pustulosus]